MPSLPVIVVFSHLRWGFVYQRPQHLLTRLAQTSQVIFIEEPVHDANSEARWVVEEAAAGVAVCTPHTPLAEHGFSDGQNKLLAPLLPQLLSDLGVSRYVAWFYTPLALPLASSLQPEAVVYDCMDELAAFANAPPQLLNREAELLAVADLVFTGGPSLYRSKRRRHSRVFCFPSSVDAAHFGRAREEMSEPAEQAALPAPRLGYFGVVDERFDVDLLAYLAEARPNWQFVIVGPIVKIDPGSLPHRPNVHYFGQQKYDDLPQFLAGWDVCLLPFARNEATKFISPTKTLEYMAAERMIVSTPITDVAEPYGDIVFLGDSHEAFLHGCERALNVSREERAERLSKMREVLAKTSWDLTSQAMQKLVNEIVLAKSSDDADSGAESGHANEPNISLAAHTIDGDVVAQPKHASVVIIGAGPTGLSAAYHLGDDALLVEANSDIGGWCRSITEGGFTFDYAGHIMFSNDEYVHQMYETLLGENVHWQDREAWIYSKETYTRYPFQGALYGLPAEVIKECLLGAIEARYGTSAEKAVRPNLAHSGEGTPAPHLCKIGNGHANISNSGNGNGTPRTRDKVQINDCCGDGILESTVRLAALSSNGNASNGARSNGKDGAAPSTNGSNGRSEKRNGSREDASPAQESENFEEFIYRVWGRGIAKHFAIPYNRKLWAVPLTEMETSWLGGRVPMPDLGEMIDGALHPSPKPMGPNARFGYPLRGGFQALMDGFLPYVEERLELNSRVASISPKRKVLTLASGEEISFDSLISTMPLPVLVKSIGNEAPAAIVEAAKQLRNVSVRCVHLGIGREHITDKHWIYYPEDTVFHRIFVQGNASPHCNPPGGFGLTCEITYSPFKPLPCEGDELIQRCIDDCIRVGIIREDDEIWVSTQCDLPYAYVVYDHHRAENVAMIREWLESHRIHLAGRYSEWEYYNSDHAFLAGKKIADAVRLDFKSAADVAGA